MKGLPPPEYYWPPYMLWRGFSVIIHFRHLSQSSKPFGVRELTSVFLFFKNVPNCWVDHSCSLCSLSERFVSFEIDYYGVKGSKIRQNYKNCHCPKTYWPNCLISFKLLLYKQELEEYLVNHSPCEHRWTTYVWETYSISTFQNALKTKSHYCIAYVYILACILQSGQTNLEKYPGRREVHHRAFTHEAGDASR